MNSSEKRLAYRTEYARLHPEKTRAWQKVSRERWRARVGYAGPWTCPNCGQTVKATGKGGHRAYCGKREGMFWAKVDKSAGPEACWPWTAAKHFRGYGACSPQYGDCRAHRVSWLYTHGSLPKGLGVLHKCDNPICVNPAHLYLGDQKQNSADRAARGRIGNRYQPVETLLHPQLSMRGKMSKSTCESTIER